MNPDDYARHADECLGKAQIIFCLTCAIIMVAVFAWLNHAALTMGAASLPNSPDKYATSAAPAKPACQTPLATKETCE